MVRITSPFCRPASLAPLFSFTSSISSALDFALSTTPSAAPPDAGISRIFALTIPASARRVVRVVAPLATTQVPCGTSLVGA